MTWASIYGWVPQGTVHEPELEIITESRKRGAIKVERHGRWSSCELDTVAEAIEQVDSLCESPIERQFGIAAAAVLGRVGLRVVPQYELSRFRYDFAVLLPKRPHQVLAFIECDGEQFHSSIEQRTNDRRKEQAAAEIGAFVMRYSGAAITRNPRDCAENALRQLCWKWLVCTPRG
jgi:hypothetical protein